MEDFNLEELSNDIYLFTGNKIKFANLPRLNCSNINDNYRDYYTEEWMIDKVTDVYKKDIALGNYSF